MQKNKIKIGMVQINNSFSGQNYLPLSLGFLFSYAKFHVKNIDDFEFVDPIYKRLKVAEAVDHIFKTVLKIQKPLKYLKKNSTIGEWAIWFIKRLLILLKANAVLY